MVKRQPQARICFGSGLERQTLEADKKGMVSRHVRSHIKENIPTLSPEMYGIQPQTTALHRVLNKVSLTGPAKGLKKLVPWQACRSSSINQKFFSAN